MSDRVISLSVLGVLTPQGCGEALQVFDRLLRELAEDAGVGYLSFVIAPELTAAGTFAVVVEGDDSEKLVSDLTQIAAVLAEGRTPESSAGVREAAEALRRITDARVYPLRIAAANGEWILPSAAEPSEPDRDDPAGYVRGSTLAYETLRGVVCGYYDRDRLTVFIQEALFDCRVDCYISEDDYDDVLALRGRVVDVCGLVRRRHSGRPMSASRIRRITPAVATARTAPVDSLRRHQGLKSTHA